MGVVYKVPKIEKWYEMVKRMYKDECNSNKTPSNYPE